MNQRKINEELLDFLDRSPNAFFAVHNMEQILENAGFTRLTECDSWDLAPGSRFERIDKQPRYHLILLVLVVHLQQNH